MNEVFASNRPACSLLLAKLFVVERSTWGATGSIGTKYTLITFVVVSLVSFLLDSVFVLTYSGRRYNCAL